MTPLVNGLPSTPTTTSPPLNTGYQSQYRSHVLPNLIRNDQNSLVKSRKRPFSELTKSSKEGTLKKADIPLVKRAKFHHVITNSSNGSNIAEHNPTTDTNLDLRSTTASTPTPLIKTSTQLREDSPPDVKRPLTMGVRRVPMRAGSVPRPPPLPESFIWIAFGDTAISKPSIPSQNPTSKNLTPHDQPTLSESELSSSEDSSHESESDSDEVADFYDKILEKKNAANPDNRLQEEERAEYWSFMDNKYTMTPHANDTKCLREKRDVNAQTLFEEEEWKSSGLQDKFKWMNLTQQDDDFDYGLLVQDPPLPPLEKALNKALRGTERLQFKRQDAPSVGYEALLRKFGSKIVQSKDA